MSEVLNDTHTTDGERYRSPAHPAIMSALGRAIWNFLSLEESVVAILFEAGWCDLGKARSMMAGGKEREMEKMLAQWSSSSVPQDLCDALRKGIEAFRVARSEYRNALGHAQPFTVGYENGEYQPGLAYTVNGQGRTASGAADLHEMAHRVEDAVDPLWEARLAARTYRQQLSPTP